MWGSMRPRIGFGIQGLGFGAGGKGFKDAVLELRIEVVERGARSV